ncbi:Mrp/NBP35 family ATP-binding protein [Rhizobium sp. L1K21]|uniref:Mrp/NBP35 family ATP-binding protein n=1 Tax=Rhizobium sp. L1K21 TaxID=2954933 RepID=UPI002092155C|nr:Mrp/NBP35 family ATP-binding protein [Rhizobium sp. L1K21]MCO6186939.1 Mrp/NBP35 family ATP-binding protein [Rhizobium sp. L1K21]
MTDKAITSIKDRLRSLTFPGADGDIVSLGLVSDIFVSDGKAYFSLSVPAARAQELEPLREAAEKAALSVDGIKSAVVVLTADKKAGEAPAQPARPAQQTPRQPQRPQQPAKQEIPGIGAIVAVASGKGGVGKSTTAVNLALAFQANGLRAAILDADIYGPSIPRLLQISGKPKTSDGRRIIPMENYGLKAMSMGFLVDEGTAMVWRGPMIQSALLQMLREVNWGDLDVLVVDMPPGTGDVQLTMAQQVPLAGSVIVSTPQDLALLDARKAINMFAKVEIPVLGVVENMSYFVCPDCGGRHDIFGHGGVRQEAEKIGAPFLGEIPLDMAIRETSDAGTPVVASAPDGVHAKAYRTIAENVWNAISSRKPRSAPEIVFE